MKLKTDQKHGVLTLEDVVLLEEQAELIYEKPYRDEIDQNLLDQINQSLRGWGWHGDRSEMNSDREIGYESHSYRIGFMTRQEANDVSRDRDLGTPYWLENGELTYPPDRFE